jgi:hypothetical protein
MGLALVQNILTSRTYKRKPSQGLEPWTPSLPFKSPRRNTRARMTLQVPQNQGNRARERPPVSRVGTRLPALVCARCANAGGLLGWMEAALPPLPFAMCFSAAEERPGVAMGFSADRGLAAREGDTAHSSTPAAPWRWACAASPRRCPLGRLREYRSDMRERADASATSTPSLGA